MKNTILQRIKKPLFVLLLTIAGIANTYAQEFTVGKLKYSIIDNGSCVAVIGHVDGEKAKGNLVIPETITYNGDSYSVTSIGEKAFNDCSGLSSISFPNSLTSIGGNAFKGTAWYNKQQNGIVYLNNCCLGIKGEDRPRGQIKLREGTRIIADNAFMDCYMMTSVVIPNSVTNIGKYAFSFCGLASIVIPNSVTTIGHSAFAGCSNLTSTIISNSVTTIGFDTFGCCSKLTSITIPNSVTSIEADAFRQCTSLTSIVIPSSVISIKGNPFWGCQELKQIIVDSENTKYDSRENCNAIIEKSTNTLITGCKNSFIPNSVTSIGQHAFECCTELTSITIPNSVNSIGTKAFYNTGLKHVTISNSVTSMAKDAFYGTDWYKDWYREQPEGPLYLDGWCLGYKGKIKGELRIRNNTKHIADNAFQDADLITLTLPNSIITIGSGAFIFCRKLTSVIIPSSVTTIGEAAFAYCQGLTSIVIPKSVTFIGDNPFVECDALARITVDPDNTLYDSRENCNAIIKKSTNTLIAGCKNSFIPNSVTSIGDRAFSGCRLTSITIPNSVTSIGQYAFESCMGLTSITIPSSVTTIGVRAFAYCYRLTSVIIESHSLRYLSYEGNLEECKDLYESDVFEDCENLHKTNVIYR